MGCKVCVRVGGGRGVVRAINIPSISKGETMISARPLSRFSLVCYPRKKYPKDRDGIWIFLSRRYYPYDTVSNPAHPPLLYGPASMREKVSTVMPSFLCSPCP